MSGKTLITSVTHRDSKGSHAVSLFEAAYDDAKLDEDRAQRLNENGGDFQADLLKVIEKHSATNQFASEEVSSSYVYPAEYKGPKPIEEQIVAIAKIFDLDSAGALKYAKNLPQLPKGAEGWFAIPSVDALAAKHFPEVTDPVEKYCRAVQLVHEKIEASRRFYNYRKGQITPDHFRLLARTAEMMSKISETQQSDILIVPAQLGMLHRGQSVRRAREIMKANEFGLGSVAIGSIVLTHPDRLVRWEELHMDVPGDEFRSEADGEFVQAPYFRFYDDKVEFGAYEVDYADDHSGSASGFLPQ